MIYVIKGGFKSIPSYEDRKHKKELEIYAELSAFKTEEKEKIDAELKTYRQKIDEELKIRRLEIDEELKVRFNEKQFRDSAFKVFEEDNKKEYNEFVEKQ